MRRLDFAVHERKTLGNKRKTTTYQFGGFGFENKMRTLLLTSVQKYSKTQNRHRGYPLRRVRGPSERSTPGKRTPKQRSLRGATTLVRAWAPLRFFLRFRAHWRLYPSTHVDPSTLLHYSRTCSASIYIYIYIYMFLRGCPSTFLRFYLSTHTGTSTRMGASAFPC